MVDYPPNPLDVPPYMGFRPGDETETRDVARSADDAQPFAGLAFKIMNDPFVGSLTFTRIYSGLIRKGDQLLNSTKGKRERVGRMMMCTRSTARRSTRRSPATSSRSRA